MNEAKVAEMIKAQTGVEQVRFVNVAKNNTELKGIALGNGKVTPTVYYDPALSDEEIVEKVVKVYNKVDHDETIESFDPARLFDREYVLPRVKPQIVKKENNDRFLSDKVVTDLLDMAVVYRVYLSDEASTVLTKQIFENANYTAEDLHEAAIRNVKNETRVVSMMQMLAEMMGMPYLGGGSEPPMIVVSNKNGSYGASVAFLNKDVLAELSESFDKDVMIIPSSIHECIVIPMDTVMENDMTAMIREVNETEVKVEEQLSDHPYIYKRDTGEIVAA